MKFNLLSDPLAKKFKNGPGPKRKIAEPELFTFLAHTVTSIEN